MISARIWKVTNTTTYRFLTGVDRLQNKSAFGGNGRGGLGDGGVGDSDVVRPALNLDMSKIQYPSCERIAGGASAPTAPAEGNIFSNH